MAKKTINNSPEDIMAKAIMFPKEFKEALAKAINEEQSVFDFKEMKVSTDFAKAIVDRI